MIDVRLQSSADKLEVPYIDPAIVEYLERVYVPTLSRDHTLREYDFQVGHLEVIHHLKAKVKEQEQQESEKYV